MALSMQNYIEINQQVAVSIDRDDGDVLLYNQFVLPLETPTEIQKLSELQNVCRITPILDDEAKEDYYLTTERL